MSCPTCKESILNQTKSLILETKCNQPCPQDITCVDIIPSNCVFYSGPNLSCPSGSVTVNYGDTVTVALDKMFQLICQSSDSNTVSVTSADTCPGYLASKITSSSLTITTVTPSGNCQTLNIEEGCFTWNNVNTPSASDGTFKTSWTNFETISAGVQKAQYSNVKGCNVKLRGTVYYNSATTSALGTTIFVLPTGFRPSSIRIFSVSAFITNPATVPFNLASFITIYTNGVVEFTTKYTGNTFGPIKGLFVPLEGIEFEIN